MASVWKSGMGLERYLATKSNKNNQNTNEARRFAGAQTRC